MAFLFDILHSPLLSFYSTISHEEIITKTCLYYFDPLKPHFYIVKLGFTGLYIIFLISAQNIECGYSLEPPRPSTHILCFEQKYEKYPTFLSENFYILMVRFSVYLNRHVFVMYSMVLSTSYN